MNKTENFFDPLKNELNKSLLKYAAGKYISCPKCDTILDWKTVVIIEVWAAEKTEYKGQQVGCKKCFHPERVEATEKANNIRLEITHYI